MTSPTGPAPREHPDATTTALLAAVLADLATLVEAIAPSQLAARTPCTQFDVAQLRHHVVGWLGLFAGGLASADGRAPAAIDDDVRADQAPEEAAAQVRAAAGQLDAALRAGAALRPLALGESAMPGEMALDMILWEYQVHGWDLARATGRPWAPPAAAVEQSLAFAPAVLSPGFQGEGMSFAPRVAVAGDAPALDRLLGLSGRDPRWAPPAP